MPSPGHQPYRRKPPAFKHGAYSAIGLLPGEDQAAYEKLHRKIIAEYAVSGPLEEYIAAELARLIWRSEHLSTFCTAELARQPFISGIPAHETYPNNETWEEVQAAAFAKIIKSKEEPARERYGERYELLALGRVVTIPS